MAIPVHVVGMAARTAVGLTAEASAAAVRARISRIMAHPFMVDAAGDELRGACDPMLPVENAGAERLLALSRGVLTHLLATLTAQAPLKTLRVLLAVPEPRPGHSQEDVQSLVHGHDSAAYSGVGRIALELAGEGHAGALRAIERAAKAVASGEVELCVAGGVDSYFHADTVDWLEQDRRIARTGSSGGFHPGEGVCLIALGSEAARRRLGLPSLARVSGIAITREARTLDSDEGMLGEGLAAAVLAASEPARQHGEVIDSIYCDINGERWRTDDWGFAALRTSHLLRDATSYVTGVGEWGDVGAATGALGCALAVEAWRRGYAAGPRALIWGASWGGLRGAVVLERGGA